MSHGAAVFTDDPNVKIHSASNSMAIEHKLIQG